MEELIFDKIIPVTGVLSLIGIVIFLIIAIWTEEIWAGKCVSTSIIIFITLFIITKIHDNI